MEGKKLTPRERAIGLILITLRNRGPLTVRGIVERIPFSFDFVHETLRCMEMEGAVTLVEECKYALVDTN